MNRLRIPTGFLGIAFLAYGLQGCSSATPNADPPIDGAGAQAVGAVRALQCESEDKTVRMEFSEGIRDSGRLTYKKWSAGAPGGLPLSVDTAAKYQVYGSTLLVDTADEPMTVDLKMTEPNKTLKSIEPYEKVFHCTSETVTPVIEAPSWSPPPNPWTTVPTNPPSVPTLECNGDDGRTVLEFSGRSIASRGTMKIMVWSNEGRTGLPRFVDPGLTYTSRGNSILVTQSDGERVELFVDSRTRNLSGALKTGERSERWVQFTCSASELRPQ